MVDYMQINMRDRCIAANLPFHCKEAGTTQSLSGRGHDTIPLVGVAHIFSDLVCIYSMSMSNEADLFWYTVCALVCCTGI